LLVDPVDPDAERSANCGEERFDLAGRSLGDQLHAAVVEIANKTRDLAPLREVHDRESESHALNSSRVPDSAMLDGHAQDPTQLHRERQCSTISESILAGEDGARQAWQSAAPGELSKQLTGIPPKVSQRPHERTRATTSLGRRSSHWSRSGALGRSEPVQ